MIGSSATSFAVSGMTAKMAAFVRSCGNDGSYSVSVVPQDVREIANKIKKVPLNYINSAGNGVTDECAEYLLPLILGECDIPYKNGIPKHFSF